MEIIYWKDQFGGWWSYDGDKLTRVAPPAFRIEPTDPTAEHYPPNSEVL